MALGRGTCKKVPNFSHLESEFSRSRESQPATSGWNTIRPRNAEQNSWTRAFSLSLSLFLISFSPGENVVFGAKFQFQVWREPE